MITALILAIINLNKVFHFSPVAMSTEELHSIHGIDERIPVNKMGLIVGFYREMAGRS